MPSNVIQIPFTGGVNERTAAEYIDPSTAQLDVVNGVYTYDGAVDKRLGVAPLPTTQLSGDPTMGAPVKLLSRGAELLATDGDSLFSYAPDGTPVWSQRALASPCVGTRAGAFTAPAARQCLSFTEGAGRRAEAYRDGAGSGGNIFLRIVSIATDAVVSAEQFVASGTYFAPVVIYGASRFFVFYSDAAASPNNNLWCSVYTPNGTQVVTTAIVSDLVGTVFDATPEAGGTGILVMYPQVDGTAVSAPRYLRLENLPALTITASAVIATGVGTTTLVACRYDGALGVVWLMYESLAAGPTYTLHAQALTTAWSSIHAVAAVYAQMPGYSTSTGGGMISVEPLTVAGTAAATQAVFMAGVGSGPGQIVYASDGSQPATGAGAAIYPNSVYMGRPFRATVGANTRCYVPIALASGADALSYLLMDTMTLSASGVTSAKVMPRVACVLAPRQTSRLPMANVSVDARVPTVNAIGQPTAGVFRIPMASIQGEEFGTPNTSPLYDYTVNVATFDFTQAIANSYCEGNGESFVSGGVTAFYDGAPSPTTLFGAQQWGVPELSFFSWPFVTSVVASTNGSGNLTLLGTYEYAMCWAQADAQGLIHRSAFFTYTLVLTGSQNAATITSSPLEFSGRFGEAPVYLEVYRTEANLQTLYFVGAVQTGYSATVYATPLTYLDLASDTSIASNPLQYTTGGVLDSVCPPSSRHIIRHVDRLWLIDDTGQNVWYSTNFNQGDAPYFNETLTLSFTREILTALAEMDDKIVCYSATSIWYVEGYGPPATGVGSDLTTAVNVPSETGAADWRSIVTVPSVGVFFQSGVNGLPYLLDRGLGVTCIGLQVQDWFADGVTVLAAAQVPQTTEVRFLLSSGYVATYSTTFERWSRQLYAQPFACAIVPIGGSWTAASGTRVYQENAPTIAAPYLDTLASGATQWITTTLELAAVKPGGLQGWAQLEYVQGLARALDPCDVTMALTYDYGQVSESRTFPWGDVSTGSPAAPGIAMWRMSPTGSNAQPMAVQATLSDAPSSSGGSYVTGRGMRWLGTAWKVSSLGPIYDRLGAGVKR
jgi:hypothetical protein